MTTTVHSTVSSGSKHRRRATAKEGRRFAVKETRKKTTIPSPATTSRKAKKINTAFRLMALGAMFFVLVSTFSLWRKRASQRYAAATTGMSIGHQLRISMPFYQRRRHRPEEKQAARKTETESHVVDSTDEKNGHLQKDEEEKHDHEEQADHSESDSSEKIVKAAAESVSSSSEHKPVQEEPVIFEELPESIEFYSRDDYKEGTRPMCRISRPIVLSNGTILVPDWMQSEDKLLRRCGLSTHGFYPTANGPSGLEKLRDIDADFVLTIHPERFQEPTHVPSVYLTEHILKSSYLFDVFGGNAQAAESVTEHHCYQTAKDTKCDLPRPPKTGLKPAIFVPRRIETGSSNSWPRKYVDMFGAAHGHGNGVLHLNASTMLLKSHSGKSETLIGTRFRSIMTTDGMFRHLPVGALEQSSFYSAKNGIFKSRSRKDSGSSCALTIGIASSKEGFCGGPDLKSKIDVTAKFAIPNSGINVQLIERPLDGDFDAHITQMQEFDVFLAGSGDDMSSMGFLHSKSIVFELMPFGIKPDTHESLARALGLRYDFIRGKPRDDDFKRCIDGEIFTLRKKGKLNFTESPDWQEPLMKAWDSAVGEHALSGSTNFDILTADASVKNYHSKACAQKQRIEIGLDDAARKIVSAAKGLCAPKTSKETQKD